MELARKIAPDDPEFLELLDRGNSGLVAAAQRFDPDRHRFRSYASWWVRLALKAQPTNESPLLSGLRKARRTIVTPEEKQRQLRESKERWTQKMDIFQREAQAVEIELKKAFGNQA